MTTWETEHSNWLRRFAHHSCVRLLVPRDNYVATGASDQVADERCFQVDRFHADLLGNRAVRGGSRGGNGGWSRYK